MSRISSGSPPKGGAANRILAIDGPAGAGKSTVAARMAEQFRLLNIETGAMYRAFAFKALEAGVALDDPDALRRLTGETTIELAPGAGGNRVLLDGVDVASRLRTPEVTAAASLVSIHAPVRTWLVGLQRQLGMQLPEGIEGVVMEGRDIGTVVFPDASVKIFLFASPEARTGRRLAQGGAGAGRDEAEVLAAIRTRDQRDSTRTESPLRPAADALLIDSTQLSLPEVVEQIAAVAASRWGLPAPRNG